MEEMLLLIIDELRKHQAGEPSILDNYPDAGDDVIFSRLIDILGKGRPDAQDYSKQVLLPYYQEVKRDDYARWQSWSINPKLERKLLRVLQIKPRRTQSGVATITVITKPWRCASDCLYCPCDIRMPKSYLSDEPACQRAERNFFDPYLQVQSRLAALARMGHVTDKVEIIVLGGSWCDYPRDYQIWFVSELFRALNDGETGQKQAESLTQAYLDAGFTDDKEELAARAKPVQDRIDAGDLSFNQALQELYGSDYLDSADATNLRALAKRTSQSEHSAVRGKWRKPCARGRDDGLPLSNRAAGVDALRHLYELQEINEGSKHRMVGFTVETRPDLVRADTLELMRQLGVTRLQIGIQSLDQRVLQMNHRKTSDADIRHAFALARVYGFKIHGHFMQNLYGSTLDADAAEYQVFMSDPAYIPDEVKLYPCSLVAGTGLVEHYRDGSWQPYSEDQLTELLAADTVATPPWVRISRMIRDISSHDIMAGSKRTNLRQMVEARVAATGRDIVEIRHREVSSREVIHDELSLDDITYETTVSTEHFLQWVTPVGRIAGFLRLSLPKPAREDFLPKSLAGADTPGAMPSVQSAMIREVHVYGKVAAINKAGESAQHFGLGRQLIEQACTIARDAGYRDIKVISSVGTRQYYRKLGFVDVELYQNRKL
ncbi:MAG: tRNA uridine(34) 5-carboxymethylaminomethyl modification radical SAM/GNAT enzyme Elp3 [Coriobacteriia bacterium]|nr:tRNA uridine(34) 5-carboxymethylaminomethyl modification radical SAM/GNAT enzyme Elp3 [Coriobacteriia bacterium]